MPPTRNSSLMNTQPRIGQELLDVPMGEMIKQMAFAIAEAQMKLDSNSIEVAQMLGGLQRITDTNANGEEVVVFEDSRVFFGKEKQILKDAIMLHNSTNDIQLRVSLRNAIGDSNYTTSNLIDLSGETSITNLVTLKSATSPVGGINLEIVGNIYKIKVGNDFEYYKYTGKDLSSNRLYVKVTEYDTDIVKQGALDENLASIFVPTKVSMLELGFSPTFYQFVDTIIEVKISIKYTQEGSQTTDSGSSGSASFKSHSGLKGLIFGGGRNAVVSSSHVNASYSQKYSYSAEGSSLLRTKLVPIPPPAILEERIRQQMELAKETPPVSTTPTT